MAVGGSTLRRAPVVVVSCGNIASAAATWYLIWLFARFSGAEAVGMYAGLIALTSPVFIGAQLGLRNLYITVQSVVRWKAFLALRAAGILVALAVAAAALTMWAPSHSASMAGAIVLMKTANSVADLYFARIQRTERMGTFGTILLCDAACTVVAATAVMLLSGSVVGAVWAGTGVAVLSAAVTCALAARTPPAGLVPERPLRQDMRLLISHGVPLALSQGIQSLLTYLPVAIVAWLGTQADVGVYSSAAYLVTFANLLGASVQTAVLPQCRRRFETAGPTSLYRHIARSGYMCLASLAPLTLVAVALGPWLLALVYGDEFQISRSAVLFFAVAAVICLPTYLFSSFHLVLNRYWVMTFVGAGAVVVVVLSGGTGALLGLGAVESGGLAVLGSIVCRYLAAEVVARRSVFRQGPVSIGERAPV